MKLFDLTGKVALITGSTRGIGKAIAEAMAEAGAGVVVSSRKSDACESVAAAIRESGADALPVPCNISRDEELEHLVDATLDHFGRIDCLVCNAAINPYYGDFLDTPESVFEKMIGANVRANMRLAKLTLPGMIERRDGSIVIVSSIAAFKGSAGLGMYALTKAADVQIVRNLAVAYGKHNVRVNAIAPALVRTDFARVLWESPERARKVEASYALGRLGEPEDIAGAAVFLAARSGAWLTGQTLILDGGWSVAGDPPAD